MNSIDIDFKLLESKCEIECYVIAKCNGLTGVEMEALTALSIALLTIYDSVRVSIRVWKLKKYV